MVEQCVFWLMIRSSRKTRFCFCRSPVFRAFGHWLWSRSKVLAFCRPFCNSFQFNVRAVLHSQVATSSNLLLKTFKRLFIFQKNQFESWKSRKHSKALISKANQTVELQNSKVHGRIDFGIIYWVIELDKFFNGFFYCTSLRANVLECLANRRQQQSRSEIVASLLLIHFMSIHLRKSLLLGVCVCGR